MRHCWQIKLTGMLLCSGILIAQLQDTPQGKKFPPKPEPLQLSTKTNDTIDVLSDTMGVDFGPYLSGVLRDVKVSWYGLIPDVARPPVMKKGNVTIEFAITKNGQVAGVKVLEHSGDVRMDRAAFGGIIGSKSFPAAPG